VQFQFTIPMSEFVLFVFGEHGLTTKMVGATIMFAENEHRLSDRFFATMKIRRLYEHCCTE